jgi:nitrogen fixation/metabolism regulation signal transduction histidine kinase
LNQKNINYLLAGIILFAGVLSYYFYEKGLYFDNKENFISNYTLNFKKDSTLITSFDFLDNIQKQSTVEKSGFNITIYKKDSLVFWNKEESGAQKSPNLFRSFVVGAYKYSIVLDVAQNESIRSKTSDFILFWLWLFGVAMIYIFAYNADQFINVFPDNKFKNSVLIMIASIVIIYMVAFFSGQYIFEFSASYNQHHNESATISLWQFGINFLSIAFLFIHLHKPVCRQKLIILKPKLKYFTASVCLSLLVYYLIVCIEIILANGIVVIKTEELLNIGYGEFTFFILVSTHLFLLIYLARQFFFSSPIVVKVWVKTLYFSIPLCCITFVFIMMGCKTNTIGIVLFMMTIFLLLDLYFEYFDINLGFLMTAVMVFSIFASSLLFKNALRKDDALIEITSRNIYKDIHKNDLAKLIVINDSIVNSTLFPSLSNLPYPQNIDVNDLTSFIAGQQLKYLEFYTISKIYCYDKKGYSLALNQISNRDKINNLLSNSEEVSKHIYYSPIDQTPLLYYIIDNIAEPTNPIHLSILFVPNKQKQVILPYKTSLAVYKDNVLIKAYNDEGYYPKIMDEQAKSNLLSIDKIGKYSIVKKQPKRFITRFLPIVTLFIAIIGLLLLLLIAVNSIFNFISEKHHLSFNTKKSLRSRFQTTIISLILLSFTLIGGTTAFYYHKLYALKNTESFTTLLNLITKEIQTELPEVDEARNDTRLEKIFSRLQNMHPLPMAFYTEGGEKIMETEDFKNAPQRLLKSHLRQLATENKLKNVKVISNVYAENQVIIPVYNSQNAISGCFLTEDSKQESRYVGLFDFISTLLTVCVFLFLTALALSMIISTPMTRSLKNLAQRLKTYKLGKTNESLEWKNPDEIGALIDNFNKMQVELNQSADLLSKTQRDLAWREMAKQVAHEIKNPLTPMKLSIQHMQMAASSANEAKMKNLIAKTSVTILEQIENLTQIADEFSSFGTLPKASNDTIILNEVVEHIHDLFRKREDMDIQMDEPMNEIFVFADKNQLVRILNNIVKNATQSIPENIRGKINIELSQNDQMAIIKVSDNGVGIDEAMKEKVFTPNFTTKSSGTGLGLAISANMIESMNGRIYFNSPNEMNGTDFFIELPLVRSVNGVDEVSLD